MKKQYKLLATSIVAITLLSGCSHKISISPSLEDIRETKVEKKVDVNVGYYISKHNKQLKVTTSGGGGDKVEYTPYKDTEGAFTWPPTKFTVALKCEAISLDGTKYGKKLFMKKVMQNIMNLKKISHYRLKKQLKKLLKLC
ncbi:hypothetical protein [Sulfurimonas sp.]|uniref:hypothetical protein n=1 Tax=Sulfurimonas sp. TaxID=2022749 RepID=UPI002AB2DA20|nr:hypothetical protein [Sulfurimonas sp.]